MRFVWIKASDDSRYVIFINTQITQLLIYFKVKRWKLIKIINGCNWSGKNLLKRSAFPENFVIMSPFTSRGGIAQILLFFRKRFSIDQYVLGAANGSFSLSLKHLTYFFWHLKLRVCIHQFSLPTHLNVISFDHFVIFLCQFRSFSQSRFYIIYVLCHPGGPFIATINYLVWNKVTEDIHQGFIEYHNFLVYRSSLKEVLVNTRNTTPNTFSISFFVVPHRRLVGWGYRYHKA